jgi:hypothetical protein
MIRGLKNNPPPEKETIDTLCPIVPQFDVVAFQNRHKLFPAVHAMKDNTTIHPQ